MRSRDMVLTKEQLILKVWGYESDAEDNNVEVYISFLRKKLEHLRSGVKIRTMENKMQIAAFNALGAIATPMPATEQYTALQQGTIDACENAIGNMLINRYYEVINNVTNTHHQFTYIFVGVSDRTWKKIPDELKPKVYEAMKTAVAWQRQNLKEINDNARAELLKKGVKFYDIDRDALKAKAVPELQKLATNVPQEWIDAYKEAVASAK